MTSEEIKNLIATKIAGQGNQIDSGGALSDILDAIVDMATGAEPLIIGGDEVVSFDGTSIALSTSEKMQELKDAFLANRPVYIDAEKTTHSYRVKVVTIDYNNPIAYAVGLNWQVSDSVVYNIVVD